MEPGDGPGHGRIPGPLPDATRFPGQVRGQRLRRLAFTLPLLLGVVVEVTAFVLLADWLGAFVAVLAVGAGTVLGSVLLANEGRRAVGGAMELVRSRREPSAAIVGGLIGVSGAIAMIVPGLVNTVVGLLMVLGRPVLTRPATALLLRRARRHGMPTGFEVFTDPHSHGGTGRDSDGDVVQGQVIEDDETGPPSEDDGPGDVRGPGSGR